MPIRRLPTHIANQIAAGEVVERPASVLKELIENALDANPSHIQVHIQSHPADGIRVIDDGVGIPSAELPLALERHATSKIDSAESLQAIETLGFRGEALASIASVADVTLVSRPKDQCHAFQVTSDNLTPQVAALPPGTSMEVCDLFARTPARKRFLKSDKTERLQIDALWMRFALFHDTIRWTYRVGDKLKWQLPARLPAQDPLRRIETLWGKGFTQHAEPIAITRGSYGINGWITSPHCIRRQPDRQFFYVNGRLVKDRLITHAINAAFSERFPDGNFPCYLLNLTLPLNEVDVNVHPTKHEVRFYQARMVHDFIASAVTQPKSVSGAAFSLQSHTTHRKIPPFSVPANSRIHASDPRYTHPQPENPPPTPPTHPFRLLSQSWPWQIVHLDKAEQAFQCMTPEEWAALSRPLVFPLRIPNAAHVVTAVEPILTAYGCALTASPTDNTLLITKAPPLPQSTAWWQHRVAHLEQTGEWQMPPRRSELIHWTPNDWAPWSDILSRKGAVKSLSMDTLEAIW